jgi:hypothetical protein
MKLISFSLWGDYPKYLPGCLANIRAAKEVYSDWKIRFYCADDIDKKCQDVLLEQQVELYLVQQTNLWDGLFWRFRPALDDNVTAFIVRDIDSLLGHKEKAAVHEWLCSDKDLHCMRDHIEHNVPILGGMWGCRGAVKALLAEKLNQLTDINSINYKGSDQDFLSREVWEPCKNLAIVHDKFYAGVTIDSYEYNPIKLFGDHLVKPYPKHTFDHRIIFVGERVT